MVSPLATIPGAVSGPSGVCSGATGVTYSCEPIPYISTYRWILPEGAIITSGSGTNSITVDFGPNAISGNFQVSTESDCGLSQPSPPYFVVVAAKPETPVVIVNDDTLASSSPDGNQWYYNLNPVPGATGQTLIAKDPGDYYVVVTNNGCSSDSSRHVYMNKTAIHPLEKREISISPVPNDGRFLVNMAHPMRKDCRIKVYNVLGEKVYQSAEGALEGLSVVEVDLRPVWSGGYFVVVERPEGRLIQRMIVN
jgi:hypothetical protein